MDAPRHTSKPVAVGDAAPDFTLPDALGEPHRLADRIGSGCIVLFFYPKDGSLGCTQQACSFRDAYEDLTEAGATVIGISSDSAESHERFATRNRLPYLLLSDRDGAVRRLYGVPRTFGLLPGRTTYIIDRRGVVRQIFTSQFRPTAHVEEALRVIKKLNDDAHLE